MSLQVGLVRYIRWSVYAPWRVFFVVTLLAAGGAYLASSLAFRNDLMDLLPDQMPQVLHLKRLLKEKGGLGSEALLLSSTDQKKNRVFLATLQKRLEKLKRAKRLDSTAGNRQSDKTPSPPMFQVVFSGYDFSAIQEKALYFLPLAELHSLREEIKKAIQQAQKKQQPGYVDLLGEEEKKAAIRFPAYEKDPRWLQLQHLHGQIEAQEGERYHAALILRPSGSHSDIHFAKEVIATLQQEVDALRKTAIVPPAMTLQFVGSYSNNIREYEGILRDIRRSGIITAIFLFLVLWGLFGRLWMLWVLLLPMAVGSLWTFAFARLTVGYLTTATGFLGVVVVGLGIDYGIYLLHRYREAYEKEGDIATAWLSAYTHTGAAIRISALTTATAFFSLVACRFKGFSHFGWMASAGVLLCLLAILAMQPALIALFQPRSESPPKPLQSRPMGLSRRVPPFARWSVALSVFLLVGGGFASFRIPFSYHLQELSIREGSLSSQRKAWERFSSRYPNQQMNPIVYRVADEKEARLLMSLLEKKQARTGASVWSLWSFLPEDQDSKRLILQDISSILAKQEQGGWLEGEFLARYRQQKKQLEASPIVWADISKPLRKELVLRNPADGGILGYLVVLQKKIDYADGSAVQALLREVGAIPLGKKTAYATGEPVIAAELMRVAHEDSLFAAFLALAVVFFWVFFILKSLRASILAMWPLLIGFAAMAFGMWLLNYSVNLFNLIVFPSLLGMGVDAGIHVLQNHRETEQHGIWHTQQRLFRVAGVASLTTVLSFASMMLSEHRGLQSIGQLAILGLTTCFLGALWFLPALLTLLQREKTKERE